VILPASCFLGRATSWDLFWPPELHDSISQFGPKTVLMFIDAALVRLGIVEPLRISLTVQHSRGLNWHQESALDRLLEFLEPLQPESHAPFAGRDPFSVDRRIELRSSQVAPALRLWAGGYERTVPAALALLAVLEAHSVVPKDVSEHIRRLASMTAGAFHEDA
jgi:hypothetical protein